jgi:hypothetical protein
MSGIVATIVGCSSRSRVDAPKWDGKSAGERAVAALDANGDSEIDAQEIIAAPGLKAAFRAIDANRDSMVSAQEIEARIDAYKDVGIGIAPYVCAIHYRGKPLERATVRLIPEDFLSDAIRPAVGSSKRTGFCYLSAAQADSPGVYMGMYRVEITCEEVDLPAKYNEATELGVEVCPGIQSGSRAEIDVFDLGA